MASNTSPIYSSAGQISWTTVLTTGNTTYDCSTGTSASLLTAGESGSFVQRIRFKASGSATASVARVFINNGNLSTIASNNVLFDEITLAATTATQTAATTTYELPVNIALPPNYQLLVTLGTSQGAGSGWYASAIGGSYLPI